MDYNKLLIELSTKENVSIEELENEMKLALIAAALDCSVEEFIESVVLLINNGLYIV